VHAVCSLLQRLRTRKASDPEQFELLFSIIEEEVGRKDDNHSKSCTKGLLWLKRCVAARAGVRACVAWRGVTCVRMVHAWCVCVGVGGRRGGGQQGMRSLRFCRDQPSPRALRSACVSPCLHPPANSALEFMTAIMGHLLSEPDKSMSEVVYEQYYATLNKWHGFWASSAFNVSVRG
jgi:hypothetical protein